MLSSMNHKIVLGTVQFGVDYGISNDGGKTNIDEISKILEYCKKLSILQMDTAPAYGNAENVLGNFNLENFKITSKFFNVKNARELSTSLNNSLNALNINKLFCYLSHRPLEVVKNDFIWKFLMEKKQEGLIEKIGISVNEVNELDEVLNTGIIPDVVQLPYNYLDRRFEKHALLLKEKNISIYARSPFLQGLLFLKPEEINPQYLDFKNYLKLYNKNKEQLPLELLKFVLKKDFIDFVVFGVNNLIQLKNIFEKNINLNTNYILPPYKEFQNNIIVPSLWQNLKK
jgi:aryl-alcohol dehydrogenase-like predicted oxidoreductase